MVLKWGTKVSEGKFRGGARQRKANLDGDLRASGIFHPLAMENKSTSTWFALRNPVFCRLWLATVLSGTFVSAQDVTATWLMHYLGASSFSLSLMAPLPPRHFFLHAAGRGRC